MAANKRTNTARKATTASRLVSTETARTTAGKAGNKGNGARTRVSSEQRLKMIELAAYFAAEKNGFKGNSTEYWARAEKEVDAQLSGRK